MYLHDAHRDAGPLEKVPASAIVLIVTGSAATIAGMAGAAFRLRGGSFRSVGVGDNSVHGAA